MTHHDFYIWKLYQMRNEIYIYRNHVGVTSPILIRNSQQKPFFPMAAALCQALPSFYSDYCTKSLFISVSSDFYKKYIVSHDYCVSTHSLCSLKNCKFHLVLIGISLSQIFQRLDKYVYIYQEIDCLYTLFKHRFYSSIVTSSGEMFNQFRRAVQHNLRWKGAKKMPSIAKKRIIWKKFKK